MRALMLWMTYLAGLESRRNEEYIQNLQNRLETGNRQLFKRNKYFFLPQNREVRRSKFAGETMNIEELKGTIKKRKKRLLNCSYDYMYRLTIQDFTQGPR